MVQLYNVHHILSALLIIMGNTIVISNSSLFKYVLVWCGVTDWQWQYNYWSLCGTLLQWSNVTSSMLDNKIDWILQSDCVVVSTHFFNVKGLEPGTAGRCDIFAWKNFSILLDMDTFPSRVKGQFYSCLAIQIHLPRDPFWNEFGAPITSLKSLIEFNSSFTSCHMFKSGDIITLCISPPTSLIV